MALQLQYGESEQQLTPLGSKEEDFQVKGTNKPSWKSLKLEVTRNYPWNYEDIKVIIWGVGEKKKPYGVQVII